MMRPFQNQPRPAEADGARRRSHQKKFERAGEFRRFHRVKLVGNAGEGTEEYRQPAFVAKTAANLPKHPLADEGNVAHGGASSGGIHACPVEQQRAAEERSGYRRKNVLPGARPVENRYKGKQHVGNDEEECGLRESPEECREYAGTPGKRNLPPQASGGAGRPRKRPAHQRISKRMSCPFAYF